jgi:opacity protein-like surface antigen
MKHIATALLCLIPLTSIAHAEGWKAEVYGGIGLAGSLTYSDLPFNTDRGSTFGIGVYNDSVVKNLSFGLDVMSTDTAYSDYETGVKSLSVMANARYFTAVSPKLEAYAGLGLGTIRVTYDGKAQFPDFTGSDNVFGGQVELGMRYKMADKTGLFAAIKHQAAFNDAAVVSADQSFSSTNVIAGISFSF